MHYICYCMNRINIRRRLKWKWLRHCDKQNYYSLPFCFSQSGGTSSLSSDRSSLCCSFPTTACSKWESYLSCSHGGWQRNSWKPWEKKKNDNGVNKLAYSLINLVIQWCRPFVHYDSYRSRLYTFNYTIYTLYILIINL